MHRLHWCCTCILNLGSEKQLLGDRSKISGKENTTFTFEDGLHQLTRTPFGIKSTLATLQRVMVIILSTVKWQFALINQDDIEVFLRTLHQLLHLNRPVLSLRREASVTVKFKKCASSKKMIDYLDHIVGLRWLEIVNHTTESINELNATQIRTKLRLFIHLGNIFCRLVPSFARIASSLASKLRESQEEDSGQLNEEEMTTLPTLQEKLISPQVLSFLWKWQYILDTESCNRRIGCVPLQKKTSLLTEQ